MINTLLMILVTVVVACVIWYVIKVIIDQAVPGPAKPIANAVMLGILALILLYYAVVPLIKLLPKAV